MLQAIRERAQGWIAWVIVFLISIPFALWGIQEYLGVGAEPVVAAVNGQEITERELDQRYQQFRNELRDRLGAAYRPDLFDEKTLRREVLDDMIRNRLILQTTVDMGLRAGDAQVSAAILAVPAFQKDGRFDKEVYERSLSFQGMVPAQFEERVRGSLMTNQLSQMIGASEFATAAELAQAVRLRSQQRSFRFLVMPLSGFETAEEIADTDIEAYFNAHQREFQVPEQVKLNYLVLDRASAGGGNAATDENALRALYQSHLDNYKTAERRQARHILVALAHDATPDQAQAARDKIAGIRSRIADGEDFAAVAREVSEDPGSAPEGGDLGFFEKGIMDPAFESAAFSQTEGELGEPVRSAFGYHLIEVTAIEPEKVKSFDEVKDELVATQQAGAADHRYFELAEQLGNLTYENPDSLVPAADALGLKIQQSDWVGRDGNDGLFAHPKLTGAAFSDDVLRNGNNSEMIEIDGKSGPQAVVLRVVEHRESASQLLEEVKAQIVAALRVERAKERAQKAAQDMAEKLRAGEDMAALAGDAYKLESPGLVGRSAAGVPAAVAAKAFSLNKGVEGGVGIAELGVGDSAVIVLDEVKDGSADSLTDDERQREGRNLARTQSRAYYDKMVDDIRNRAQVKFIKKEES